jgi:hypothetical protein
LNSSVIDQAGLDTCCSLYRRKIRGVTSFIQKAAIKSVVDAAGHVSESLRGDLPVQALASAFWNSGNAIVRLLDSPASGGCSRTRSSASAPLTLSTVPQ